MPLPWGFGSMAFHGRNWWLTWRDPEGKVHYENSGTDDAREAQKIMANRALPRADAMLRKLMAIANGEETYREAGKGKNGKRPGPGSVAPVGPASAAASRKVGSQGTRGGKA